ncbi:DEKNAAC100332 [Brettanomyces naardenensis]|uniref:DEKNAAC100332 n=1 Tax=Brettanomyces naardenensis TaxID=13370 RepID=A0A448YFK2_BRENA|nr:DEKNAAC100332 [Brettanomyces naardenensis]
MPPRPKVSELEIEEKFIKGGSGNGGQKINKTNSKVQLKHIPTGIVVTSQATRSRDQNRKIAREILAMKLDEMEKGKESRAQLLMARKQMVKRRSKKKSKAKYRKLEEEKKTESESNVETEQETTIVDEDEDIIVVK